MTRARARFVLASLLVATCARAQVVPQGFAVQTLAQNLAQPVAIQFMPDGRILFAEQLTGRVRVLSEGVAPQANPVLQLTDVAIDGGERGLLGVALDPGFPARPYLYVHYTATSPNRIRISRFTLTGDLAGGVLDDLKADTLSRYDLIDDIPDQATNHNGGTVRFAADGFLYASIGEDAQPCLAQDTTQLRGKVLRLQTNTLPPGPGSAFRAQITPFNNPFVSRPDSNARLVAALGLRNPFRIQPDRVRNWLVIGDPGENTREELDVLVLHLPTARPAQPELGADFGWPFFEGSVPGPYANTCGPVLQNLAAPAFEYDRTSQLGGAAIIAAGAYWATGTGSYDFPNQYAGDLFANDYYSGTLYHLVASGNGFAPGADVAGQPAPGKWGTGFDGISDWALGRDGGFYFCRQSIGFAANSGVIGRVICTTTPTPVPPPGPTTVTLFQSPAVNGARFYVTVNARPATLTIHDVNGRRVRRLTDAEFVPQSDGRLEISWDGRDDDGRKVYPGLYLGRLESGGDHASVRVPFLR
jgi:glucose/arabinose dehydrogenase